MIERIGVVGAGQMGSGIAHVAALAGLAVRLSDVSAAALEKALAAIARNLGRQVEKGRLSEADRAAALARIDTSDRLESLRACDLVIEAVPEDETIKRETYRRLCPLLAEGAILCSNTSSISITRLASHTDRPGRFMGMHFMNPVPVMQLVELIRGIATEEATFRAVHELAVRLGKTPAVSQDLPAFIVNRVLVPMINEAIFALYEGVASVEAIDTAMTLGTNQPMGPLTLADFIGLDTCLAVMQVLHDGFADSKYRPCPLLVKYVEAGWLGRKTGRGFYDYSLDPPRPTR
ncbi:MAG: 3-hydroxybutyryl-CoA dehydrogenase [Proteobacteria bacterium]|nr:3-hydroxybutyryl-CoA dehydrogenase [Pseudomonadota bacterium]